MKKYLVLCCILICLLPAIGFAQVKPLIAVLPFESIEVSASISRIISTLFETNLVNTGEYEVLSQNERDQILSAQKESLQGCTDEACAIEIGQLLAAEQIIIGTVAALGTKFIINAKIIDVTTSKTLGADSISADSVETLDIACANLTNALVKRAIPTFVAEGTEPEPEPEPEPTPEPEPEPEPVAEETPAVEEETVVEEAVEEEPAEKPKPKPVRREVVGSNLVSTLTFAAGILIQDAANVLNTLGFEHLLLSQEYLNLYREAGEGADFVTLYENYEWEYFDYTDSTLASYVLSGVGAGIAGTSLFLFPNGITLSSLGKVVFSAGIGFIIAGNVLGNAANSLATDNAQLFNDYMATTDPAGIESLYSQYQDEFDTYGTFRRASVSMWLFGGVATVGSLFLPGIKTETTPTFMDKLLMSGGLALISAGNYFLSVALDQKITADEYWNVYMETDLSAADQTVNDLYLLYEDTYNLYTTNTFLAIGTWVAGGALVLTSVFVPFDLMAAGSNDIALFEFFPTATGFTAGVRIQL